MEAVLSFLGLVVVLVIALFLIGIPSTLLRGYVVSKLWLWHVVPVFHLEPLTISQAISVSLIFAVLTHEQWRSDKKDESNADKVLTITAPFITNLLLLFVGWVIHVLQ